MSLWGKGPAKGPAKRHRPERVAGGRVRRVTPGNLIPGPGVMLGRHEVAAEMATRLHTATVLISPAVMGRFRAGGDGAATSRGVDGASPDLGMLQTWRNLVAGIGRPRVGTGGGPSSQPGYPSTGRGALADALARMSLPDIRRFR